MKIDNSWDASCRQENIARLQVAMNDALSVDIVDDLSNLYEQAEGLRDGIRLAGELVGQATMRHILQRQVRSSVPPAASMNGHNGWMSEQGSQLGGTTQPGFPFFLGAYSGHEHF